MKTENRTSEKILSILLKEPFTIHTATSIARSLGITRQGTWKTLNRLLEDKLIVVESVGNTKTSTSTIKLNWSNPITEKILSLILTRESLKQRRWMADFSEIDNSVNFAILFGSILSNPKEADDIDLLAAVDKRKFKEIEEKIAKVQQTQLKKIHLIDLTLSDLGYELKKQNKAYMDAIKKGIILYGQDNFIRFIGGLQNGY